MSSEIKLYSNEVTSNGIKMSLLFNAVGIEPIYQEVSLHKGEHMTEEFLAINPNGKIPAIIDNNIVLTESNAILHYITNKYESDLWPKSLACQSEVLKWLFWQSSVWADAVGPFNYKNVVLPYFGINRTENISLAQLALFEKAAKILEDHLITKTVLVDGRITIADISIASLLFFAVKAKVPLNGFPRVTKWLSYLEEETWWKITKDNKKHLFN
jgi:glutathione S-transferase